jgi:hypothetical protein
MSFRSKPIGWRGEPYRHALAAKGYFSKKNPYSALVVKPKIEYSMRERVSLKLMRHGPKGSAKPYKMLKYDSPHFPNQVQYHKSKGRVVVALENDEGIVSEKAAVFQNDVDAKNWATYPYFWKYRLKYFAEKKFHPKPGSGWGGMEWMDPDKQSLKRTNHGGTKAFLDGVKQETQHPVKSLDREYERYRDAAGKPRTRERGVQRAEERGAALIGRVVTQANMEPLLDHGGKQNVRDVLLDIEFGRE